MLKIVVKKLDYSYRKKTSNMIFNELLYIDVIKI